MSSNHSKKLFGTFLVERGVVTEEEVAEALRLQQRMRPSKRIVALRLGVLSLRASRTVGDYMAKHGCAFEAAVLALGLPARQSTERITTERAKYDPRLGVVLMMMGKVEADELYTWLQSFDQERRHEERLLRVANRAPVSPIRLGEWPFGDCVEKVAS